MIVLRALLLLCALAGRGSAQPQARPAQFAAAVAAFEGGDNARTISLLAAYERAHGTSPRLESLRALAYRDLGRPREAHRALLVYFRLTAEQNLSGNAAHADLRRLRTELLEQIENEYTETRDSLAEARVEAAEEIVEELETTYASPAVRIAGSTALPEPIRQALARDPSGSTGVPGAAPRTGATNTAERELWARISQSTSAMDFYLFAETFPNGQYAEQARRRMMEIGDPAWNAVRNGFVPAELRAFITANPNSPFRDAAAAREQLLIGVDREWEQLMANGNRPDGGQEFEVRYQWHPLAAKARQLREDRTWTRIEGSNEASLFRDFAAEFPESPRAALASARYAAILERELPALLARIPQYGGTSENDGNVVYSFHYVVNGACSVSAIRSDVPHRYNEWPQRREYPIVPTARMRLTLGRMYSSGTSAFVASDSGRLISEKITNHSRNPLWGPYTNRDRSLQRLLAAPTFETTSSAWIGILKDVETAERFKADLEMLGSYCASLSSNR